MAVTVNFVSVQQIVITATITDGPASGYYDAITFTAPVDFAAATPAQILQALGLTAAQVRQQFADRFQVWKANQAAARVAPSAADLTSIADSNISSQDQVLAQMDAPTRLAYLQGLQARITAKIAQG